MITTYVAMRSALTACMQNWQKEGYTVHRTRLTCGCHQNSNIRQGVIVIDGNNVKVAEIIRCKGCFNAYLEGISNGNN